MRISDWSSDVCSSDLCLVALPYDLRVAFRGVAPGRMREGSDPGPRIGPHEPDALPGQKERRLLSHATSFVKEIGASIGCPRRRVHENDIERLLLVADPIELALPIGSANVRTPVTHAKCSCR